MNKTKKSIIFGIIIIMSFLLSTLMTAAVPSYDIELSPNKPKPSSSITFTVTFSDDSLTDVNIIVAECKIENNDESCFADMIDEPMDKIGSGEYQKQVTLKHSDATYIKYWLAVEENGEIKDLSDELVQIDLDISTSAGEDNGDDSEESPGFELLVLLVSLVILIAIIRKKRDS